MSDDNAYENVDDDALLQDIRVQMDHVARGCRSGNSHEPTPYVTLHKQALEEVARRLAYRVEPVTTVSGDPVPWMLYCPHGQNQLYGRCAKCAQIAAATASQRATEAMMERIAASLERHAEILERLSK